MELQRSVGDTNVDRSINLQSLQSSKAFGLKNTTCPAIPLYLTVSFSALEDKFLRHLSLIARTTLLG